jgi:ribosomal protein S18 acetylase RimI-like enzyme
MNLFNTISLYAGGPGSGCRGPNCGRHRTAVDQLASKLGLQFGLRESKWRGVVANVVHPNRGEVGSVTMGQHPTDSKSMFIDEAGIHPDYRHQGLGPAMYSALFEYAKEHGKDKVYSSPNRYRTKEAAALWERLQKDKEWTVKKEKGRPYVSL